MTTLNGIIKARAHRSIIKELNLWQVNMANETPEAIKEFAAFIEGHPELEKLDFGATHIGEALPKNLRPLFNTISQLPNPIELDLSSSRLYKEDTRVLTMISKELMETQSKIKVDLSANGLHEPTNDIVTAIELIHSNKNLIGFGFSKNGLGLWPDQFFKRFSRACEAYEKLEELVLRDNELYRRSTESMNELAEDIDISQSLKKIDLAFNHFSECSDESAEGIINLLNAVIDLPALTSVDLSTNGLCSFVGFDGMKLILRKLHDNIEELGLCYSELNYLTDEHPEFVDWFADYIRTAPCLKKIDVSTNFFKQEVIEKFMEAMEESKTITFARCRGSNETPSEARMKEFEENLSQKKVQLEKLMPSKTSPRLFNPPKDKKISETDISTIKHTPSENGGIKSR